MVLTFIISMLLGTTMFITTFAICVWNKRENFPVALYVVSIIWQLVSFFAGITEGPRSQTGRVEVVSNFTEAEIIVAGIGLVIGILTSILIFFDYRWYEAVHESYVRMKDRWIELFPPKSKPTSYLSENDILNDLKRKDFR